jgi:transglutaminase-like putative cysteine protease
MPRVRIIHSTEYVYVRPVRVTAHRLMIRPRDSHDLRLISTKLGINPPAAKTRWAHDVFGNSICYVEPTQAETDRVRFVSDLDLHHYPTPRDLPLDPVAQTYPFSYSAEESPDLARLTERHYPDPDRVVDRWARRFVRRNGPTETLDMLIAMTQAIKADMRYRKRDAEGTNSPVDTLAFGSGACRDLALLMMEAVRSLGFAAMFVSGYLYDDRLAQSATRMVGGGSTHAWCMVYLPGAGWVEFDPTNGLIAGRNLIRVCWARTPEQAVPIAGGYIGTRGDFRDLHVNVEVTVGDAPATQDSDAGGSVPPATPKPKTTVPDAMPTVG